MNIFDILVFYIRVVNLDVISKLLRIYGNKSIKHMYGERGEESN